MRRFLPVFIFASFFIASLGVAAPGSFSAEYEGSKYLFGKAKTRITLASSGLYYKYTMRS